MAVALAALAAVTHAAGTKWNELTPERQSALKPLAGEWDSLSELRRKKWINVADSLPRMKPEERKRVEARMAEWARMTPEQRRVARENYNKSKALPAEQKKAQWAQYQTLPDTQKQQLAATIDQKKPAQQKAKRRESEGIAKPAAPARPKAVKPAAPGAQRPAAPARPMPPAPAVAPATPAAPASSN